MEPRFLIQNFNSSIFSPIFNISIPYSILQYFFDTSIFCQLYTLWCVHASSPGHHWDSQLPWELPEQGQVQLEDRVITERAYHRNKKTYLSVPADEEVHVWCETFDLAKGDTLRVGGKELSILIYHHRGKWKGKNFRNFPAPLLRVGERRSLPRRRKEPWRSSSAQTRRTPQAASDVRWQSHIKKKQKSPKKSHKGCKQKISKKSLNCKQKNLQQKITKVLCRLP